MRLETVERWVRGAGALAVLVAGIAVYSGFVRGLHHPKGRSTGLAPATFQQSARFYVPAGIAGPALLYLLWRPIRPALSGSARLAATAAGALLYFPGLALILWGRTTMGDMHNISSSLGVQLYADHRLVTSGPFALVRHPMYVGGIMAELGAVLLYRTWAALVVAVNVPVLLLRAGREEEALSAEFGEQWEEYRRRVPAWIPRPRG